MYITTGLSYPSPDQLPGEHRLDRTLQALRATKSATAISAALSITMMLLYG